MTKVEKINNDVIELKKYISNILLDVDKKYKKNNNKIISKLDTISDSVEETNKKLISLSKKITKLERDGVIWKNGF